MAPFAKLHSRLYTNPKLRQVSGDAFRVVVFSWGWAAEHETDGHVPDAVIDLLGAKPRHVRELVNAGLWHRNGAGYVINDYLEHNKSKAEMDAARAKGAAKKRRQRGATDPEDTP